MLKALSNLQESSAKPEFEILTIQKFIYLLDDTHYHLFTTHLSNIKASLPLKLSEEIRKRLPNFDPIDVLCKKVYGKQHTTSRAAFNQLTSHTFKQSNFLAQNYPYYLLPNFSKLQTLVNSGNASQAEFMANSLLQISERIEDFQTQILSLKFLAQQSYLRKDFATGFRLDKKLVSVVETEKNLDLLISTLRKSFNIFSEGKNTQTLTEHNEYFRTFHQSEFASLRIYSLYASLYSIYYFEPDEFSSNQTLKLVKQLETQLENNSYVVFPFLFDVLGTFNYLKLNSSIIDFDNKEHRKQLQEFTQHANSVLFWKSYLSLPQMFYIAIRTTHFLTAYHHQLMRRDYQRLVKETDMQEINELAEKCRELLEHDEWEKIYKLDMMSLRMLYGCLLILSGGDKIQKGIDELEFLLTAYQQMNLAGSTDSIYVSLMIGYFALKKYEKCVETYKRYYKFSREKKVYEVNDITIHVYYYLAAYLTSERSQYLVKLRTVYQNTLNTENFESTGKPIEDLVLQLNIPLQLK